MSATANLTWSAVTGATSYIVEYKKSSDSSWTQPSSPTNPTTGTSYQITGLDEGTAYDFGITAVCSAGNATRTIKTGTTSCPNVSNLSATFSSTTANLVWDRISGVTSYSVYYKVQSAGSYTEAPSSPKTNPSSGATVSFAIASLSNGTAYDFKVVTNCTGGVSSGVTTQATSTCPAVTGLGVSFT